MADSRTAKDQIATLAATAPRMATVQCKSYLHADQDRVADLIPAAVGVVATFRTEGACSCVTAVSLRLIVEIVKRPGLTLDREFCQMKGLVDAADHCREGTIGYSICIFS